MAVDIDFANLSLDDLMALAKRANEVKRDILNRDAERLAALVSDFVTTVVAERAAETSEKSGWHGIKVYGLPVKVDGVEFSVSVTLTDVKTTDANKAAAKAKGDTPEPEPEAEGDTPEVDAAGEESSEEEPAPPVAAKRGRS